MFYITIIFVGKVKESYWKEAEQDYLIRLQPYMNIETIEIKEVSFRSMDEKNEVSKKEAGLILAQIPKDAHVYALDGAKGTKYDSVSFSKRLDECAREGEHHLTFIIGGSMGLHQLVIDRANHLLSLSHMTFPHQLARVVFVEQLYRAATILKGKQYHY